MAKIVLRPADRVCTISIMRKTAQAKPGIWRRQARYVEAGVGGLLRDQTVNRQRIGGKLSGRPAAQ